MSLLRTPFFDFHQQSQAKLVDFAGWEMPLLYRGIIPEHLHTRSSASIFDVSHMGRLRFSGAGAAAFLQKIVTRNLEKTAVGQSKYALVCNLAGGVLDDVIISRFEKDWLMVCNASNREKILAWLELHRPGFQVQIEDETFKTSMVAIQGPKAVELLDSLLPNPIGHLKRYHFSQQRLMMMFQFTIFRSGYTGEDGVEVILPNNTAQMAINYLLRDQPESALLKPAGLGARDTLRIEAGMPLYGHELNEEIDPLTASLGWAVDLTKDFIGVEALREIAAKGTARQLVGLKLEGPRSARQGAVVYAGSSPVGIVSSGTTSPTLKCCIAMAFIDRAQIAPGTALSVDLRGTQVPATVTALPFYKHP